MRSVVYCCLLAGMVMTSHGAWAQNTPAAAAPTTQESDTEYLKKFSVYQGDMKRIESYLNGLKTFSATFTQTTEEGEVSTGMFYLSRPGKLRWDYDPPNRIVIIAKGSLLTYYDVELEQVSHVGLDDTMAGFLTREIIDFTQGVEVLSFDKKDGMISITIAQTGKEDEGNLTLLFKDSATMELVKMRVVDSIGKGTIIEFSGSKRDVPLDKSLFVLPKISKKRQ